MALKDAGDELDDLYQYLVGGVASSESALSTGDVLQMIKYIIAAALGSTAISPSAVFAGSLAERVKWMQDNAGQGMKKVQGGGGTGLPATGTLTVTSSATPNVFGSAAVLRAAGAGNAIFIKGFDYYPPNGGGRSRCDLQLALGSADSGTASGVSATTLTDSGKSWTTDAYVGSTVTMGGKTLVVTSNTGTVLTGSAGWVGGTPSTGAYTVVETPATTIPINVGVTPSPVHVLTELWPLIAVPAGVRIVAFGKDDVGSGAGYLLIDTIDQANVATV